MSTPPETGFALHVPRAMLRYGPYKSKSRKRRRHRIRQWRAEHMLPIEGLKHHNQIDTPPTPMSE